MQISTIIPSYNRADLIAETLRSVLSQSRPPHEVIVVDDGSIDGTPDVVAGFGKDVTLVRQANGGAGSARNNGLARASGDVIHFMDSDDLCTLDSYALAMDAMMRGADMTYGPWLKTQFFGDVLHPEPFVQQQHPIPSGSLMSNLVLSGEWVTVFQSCFFRRDLLQRAGPYRTDLKPSEDTELLYRIARCASAPAHVADGLLLYRVHPENQISEANIPARMLDQANLWAVLQKHLDERDDLDAEFKRKFRASKCKVAHEVIAFDQAKAADLLRDVSWLEEQARPFRRFANRVSRKMADLRLGHRYTAPFGVAPLTPNQRAQIAKLGYRLPDGVQ